MAVLLSRWAEVEGDNDLLSLMQDFILKLQMSSDDKMEGRFKMSQSVAKWAKDALNVVVFSADTIEVLLKILDADYGKVVSSNQLLHWRAGILANAVRKPGRPGLLCSFSDGRSRVSRLSNMLPRVAEIIIDVTPAKLNERFEELKQGIVDGRKTDRGSTLSLPLTMSGLRIHHEQVCLFGQKGGRGGGGVCSCWFGTGLTPPPPSCD